MSSTSKNQILKLMALKILRKIANEIAATGWHSILAHEATDVGNTQQIVTCIRWVTMDLEVKEDFTDLVPLQRAQADVIAMAMKDVLISNAKDRCYDDCSTMVGSKKGVATIIKQSQLNCLLIYCYCHTLNLAVGDVIKNFPLLKKSLEDAYELTKLIKYSPKRQADPQRKQEGNLELTVNTSELMESANYSEIRLLCPTRWTLGQKHSTPSTIITNQSMNG